MIMTGVETRHRLPHQQPRQPPSSVRTKQEGVRQQELSNLEVDISILMPTQSYADSSDYTPTVSLSILRDWLSAFHAQVLNLKLVLQTIHRFHNNGKGPSRGLLRDCNSSPINRLQLQHSFKPWQHSGGSDERPVPPGPADLPPQHLELLRGRGHQPRLGPAPTLPRQDQVSGGTQSRKYLLRREMLGGAPKKHEWGSSFGTHFIF